MADRMKLNFGVLLPTREAVMSRWTDASGLFQIAERAEALGFHSVWVGDSLTARRRADALTMLTAVGARTRRVRLGTAIYLAALRNPILLAYQLASLDWITGGRVDFGIGYGRKGDPSQEHEFDILGLPSNSRIKLSEEVVQLLRRLWCEEKVTSTGQFYRFSDVTLEPRPAQSNGIPIWLASNNVEPGLKRVGRLGDAWLNNIKEPQVYRECWDKIGNYAAAAGRDPAAIHPSIYLTVCAGDQRTIAAGHEFLAEYYDRPVQAIKDARLCFAGTWDQIIDTVEEFGAAGARTVIFRFAARDQASHLEQCAEALRQRALLS